MAEMTPVAERFARIADGALRLVPGVAVGLVVLALAYVTGRLVNTGVRRAARRLGRHMNVALILGALSQWLVVVIGALTALVIVFPSFEVRDLVQMLGIASVAIGFAFRDILQNFLAGIIILWTQPFRIGDQIVFGEFEGTVTDVQTRATVMSTYDGRRIVIPNAQLFTNPVTVNTAAETRRVEYDVGIGVDDDVETAKHVILRTLSRLDAVLPAPAPDVLVFELADFSVKLRVRWWINPPNRASVLDARDVVLSQIKSDLGAAGITLPYPTTTVLLRDDAPAPDEEPGNGRQARGSRTATSPAGAALPRRG